jgi:AraC-like DNA-binding protein
MGSMVNSDSVVQADSAPPTALPQHVKRALGYLRANMAEKVTLAVLAAACGISQRALLTQFERFLGVSPIAHLLRMRLTAARAQLQQSDGTASISEIASRCGLTHLGRFATEYRRTFGELPSATLRRAAESADNARNDCRASAPPPFVAYQRPSLIILPLRTETLQERQIAQELMEQLAATISRTSVASVTFADPTFAILRRTVRSPRERANAEYCLNGRLVQRDARIRVTLWLVDTQGRHVWGDSYDGTTDGAFDLLQRIVDGAVCGVVPGIGGAEIARIQGKDPETLKVREMIQQALPVLLKIDWDSSRKVFAIATRAMEIDPDDALPFAVAAYCQARLYADAATASPPATRSLAHHLVHRAGILDTGDPLVTTARAAAAALSRSDDDVEALVDRALAMDPTSGWAWERRGCLFCWKDPDVAIACFTRALQLHGPFMPKDNCFLGIAQAHEAAGRFDALSGPIHGP